MTFNELNINSELVAAMVKQGIVEPTAIQVAALPVLLEGKDAYLKSETGTGKTLAYLLPLFCRIDIKLLATQVAIVAPTHELAIQIQRQCCDLAQQAGLSIRSLLLIGGTSMKRQLEKLKKKPHIVIGSPGRIRELINLKKLKANKFKSIVVDEADRLLIGESRPIIQSIIKAAPPERQLIFISATEQPESAEVIATLAPNLFKLETASSPVNPNIEHLYLVCEERDKPDVLRKLFHALCPTRAIVFVHRNETAEIIASKLAHHQIQVADLHGAFYKQDRKQAMDDFRSGKVCILIASDIAARGLDIPGITHIFNLDVPTQSKAYLHRVGRTARAGAKGQAVTLMTDEDTRLIHRYEKELGIVMHPVRLREGYLLRKENRKL